MEIIGLAVGIPGLFSACMDILEKIEAYKDFRIESRQLIAQFEAAKLRLKKWAIGVGMPDGKWTELYDAWLQDHDLELAVKRVLKSASEIFNATERTRSRLPVDAEETNTSFPDIPGFSLKTTKKKEKTSIPRSIRGGLVWAFKRRGKLTYQVDMFRQHVELLYNLVPISTDELSLNESGSASFHKDIQMVIENTKRLALQQVITAINGWLSITKCDEQYDVGDFFSPYNSIQTNLFKSFRIDRESGFQHSTFFQIFRSFFFVVQIEICLNDKMQ